MQGSARIDELRQKFHENPRRYFAPLANEYRKAGDPEQAIAICRAHLAQQPAHMSGHVVYARALYDAGRIDESRVVFEKALSLDPDNAIVLRHLGDISRQKGDAAEARHWYTRALDADPHDREIAAYIAELTDVASQPVSEMAPEVDEDVKLAEADEQVEIAAAEESSLPDEVQIDIPTTEEPPAMTDTPGFEADEALFAADEDIELFPDLSSPFVTRTMADLYAKQGFNDQALEVYRKLAADNPHDQHIADRIRDLSPGDAAPAADAAPAPEDHPQAAAVNEFADGVDEGADFDFVPPDENKAAQLDEGSAELTGDSSVSSESPETSVHFTETELGVGDEWDADAWAAGFSSDETTGGRLELESVSEAEFVIEEEAPPLAASDFASALPPLGVLNDVREEERHEDVYRPGDEPEPADLTGESIPQPSSIVHTEFATEPAEGEHFVAYSPQPPEDEDLPHYTPVGPTIREFFATLGAYQPPANGAAASFTARAAVPDMEAEPSFHHSDANTSDATHAEPTLDQPLTDEFPLVSDAFANLFPDSPVSEEDSKAAFALSGALSSQPNQPVTRSYSSPASPTPAVDLSSPPTAARESEDDIRKFREWLDGLADS